MSFVKSSKPLKNVCNILVELFGAISALKSDSERKIIHALTKNTLNFSFILIFASYSYVVLTTTVIESFIFFGALR